MTKRIIYCENCENEYKVQFKTDDEPKFCPFCSEEIDIDWNTSEIIEE